MFCGIMKRTMLGRIPTGTEEKNSGKRLWCLQNRTDSGSRKTCETKGKLSIGMLFHKQDCWGQLNSCGLWESTAVNG